jgi:hypothetical protein
MSERSVFHDRTGKLSALRVVVVPAGVVGIVISIAGAVAMFLTLPAAGVAMTTGAGIIATAVGAKAWQRASEKDS